MLTAKEIRETFKRYFEERGHHIVPSAPMVIKDDPTLMFTNAGMNQFKDIILGNKEAQWRRVADSQKCLRVSGKHNDLEEVGHDTYHHTMFEMLGNWSFGDYFKHEAIDWAWDLLVNVYKLDPTCLYATVFEGDKNDGLERDDEAAGFWETHLPKDHILNGNRHDNFWEMGDTGPCGPCSEVHIDLRSEEEKAAVPGASLVNKDNPLVIEIWNLVFMQFNRKADGTLEPLPNRVIDTGMGLERLCMALQGKKSNYDTDVFQPLIGKLGEMCGKKYGENKDVDVAMRVVADHVRTIAFSIADGQLPSNAKAGYVIRRILRRAVRYGYTFLGFKEAFMYRLIDTLIESMGEAYPEIKAQADLIKHVTKEEEDAFLRTLDTGMKLIEKVITDTKAAGKTVVDGKEAFTLYDTFGFPLDLTELILRENGMTVNEEEFNVEMQKQKQRARNAAAVEATDWVELKDGVTEFVGYDLTECDVNILRYRKVTQKNKSFYQIVLDRTPFYAEMGGQVGDRGVLKLGDEVIEVTDTKRENNLPVHITAKLPSDVNATLHAVIDVEARRSTECNHTATHLLHAALRQVLGTHVEQKGSYVDPHSLRFDFSHFRKVTPEEIRQVEHLANKMIRNAITREEHREMPIDEARQMGAMALFGEKYGDHVRVIKYGDSVELCGGTHVPNTGNIGIVRIVSESSIAAGIRRIEAITGAGVEDMLDHAQDTLGHVKELLNNAPDAITALQKSLNENAELKKQVDDFTKQRIAVLAKQLENEAKAENGMNVITLTGKRMPDIVKGVALAIKADCPTATAFLAATEFEDKPMLTVMLSEDLVKSGLNAGNIVRGAAKCIQGGGGGQPHFAQAGGRNAQGLEQALQAMREALNL
ncbi:MAG: alanine--tRNA ligase [Muribaculaceae bacterium]|nr:alanine--tRNA ligase [Muribaculaceae bacterium]MBQ7205660.1 alanine--tRNA ligase [Muribaculaceae bacterium]